MTGELVRGGEKAYTNVLDCIRKTWAQEGLPGVQRGLPLACVRDASKCFFRLGLYEPVVNRLHDSSDGSQAPFYKQLAAGATSGMAASVICNPLDIVKVRVQTAGGLTGSHHDIKNLGPVGVCRAILREEGVLGLWKGTNVNVTRGIAFTATTMSSKARIKRALKDRDVPLYLRDIISSAIGSLLGVLVMNPIDVVRTRLYNQPAKGELYSGPLDAASKIYRQEGITAFWKGGGAHYLRVGPHTILSFLIIGKIQALMKNN